MPDTNSNRFDRDLRGKAGGYRKEPNNRVWEKLQTNLATPAPRKNYRAAGFVLLGLLLVLLGNLLPEIGNLALPQNHKPKAEAQTETPVSASNAGVKRKLSYAEKREYEQLEADIAKLEQEKEALVQLMSGGAPDHNSIAAWGKQLEYIETELEKKGDRWLELAEFAD